MNDTFRRDFETAEEYRARLVRDDKAQAEAEAGRGEAGDALPPSPFVFDCGIHTSRRDRDAIQAEEDRITRLERMGR